MEEIDRSPQPPTSALSPENDIGSDEVVNEVRLKECLQHAEELKLEGNEYFRAKQWNEALVSYRTGLSQLPPRREHKTEKGKERAKEVDLSSDEEEDGNAEQESSESEAQEKEVTGDEIPIDKTLAECSKARAVMNANIGACHVKLGDHKEAVNSCAQALLDDPKYVKARQRRAASNEEINSWTSLTSAQEDYTALLELLPPSSSQLSEVKRSLQLIKPRVEAAQKKETGEMLDKLKGLGNSLLGNFGLSTDNFKFEPNGQGGYSMNFVR